VNLRRSVPAALAAISIALLLAGNALAETEQVPYAWTEPTAGTAPVGYRVEIRFRSDAEGSTYGPWGEMVRTGEATTVLDFERGNFYQVRVRAEDAAGRLGPYSEASVEYLSAQPGGSGGNQANLPPLPPGKPTTGG